MQNILVEVENSANVAITSPNVKGWPVQLWVSMLYSEKMAILSYHSSVVLFPVSFFFDNTLNQIFSSLCSVCYFRDLIDVMLDAFM